MAKNFYRKVLKNGMTVIFEKRDLPVVSMAFAVRYGGVNESVNERGIAHFIEHMLYKGTKKRSSKQISTLIEKNGGILNGFTDETITAFWCKLPSDKLKIGLDVLGDMVRNPLLDQKELGKERQVIFEEMKIYHDNPVHYVFDSIQGSLYKDPLGTPLIGTHESMNSITRKKMSEKFREVYKAGDMILCVVGNADMKEITGFAEKNFKKAKSRIMTKKIEKRNKTTIETRKGIDQANLVFAFHSPLSTDKRVYASKVLMSLMANGLSSRLFTEIREKRNLAYSIMGDVTANRFFSYSYVYVGTRKDKVDEVKKLILSEFKKVSEKLSDKELEQAKQQVIGNYRISMEDSSGQMHQLLLSEIDGNAEDFYRFEENVKKVKLKDVKSLAKIKDHSFFALVPE